MHCLADRVRPKGRTVVTLGLAVVLALLASTSKSSTLQVSNAQTSTSQSLLFQDDFESANTSAWDQVYTTGTSSSVQVSKAAAYAGAYGLDTTKSGKNDNGHALVYKAITAPANHVMSIRTRMRIVSRSGTGSLLFEALYRNAPIYQPIVAIRHNGTSYVLRLHRLDGSVQEVPLSMQIANGTWYDVELVYAWNGQRPVATAYLNGRQVASITDTTQGTLYAPDNIFVGLYEDAWTQQAEAQWDSVSATNYVQSVGSSLQFSDGFETGNTSKWHGLATKGQSSTVRASTGGAYSGNFGLDTAKFGRNDNGEADIFKNLTAPSTHVVSLRTRMRIVSRAGSGILQLQRLYVHAPAYQPIVSITNNGSAYSLVMRERNGTLVQKRLTTQFSNATWYDLELVYDWSASQPIGSVYVNGALAATMADSTAGTVLAPDSAYVGLQETYWTQQAEVQWDNVSLAGGLQSSASSATSASSEPAPDQTPPSSASPTPTNTPVPESTGASSTPAAAPSTTPDEWTQDEHDAQHTGATSEEPNESWSYAWSWNGADAQGGTGGHFYQAPTEARTVVGAGHLYVPAGAEGLYALNLADGSQAWHLASAAFNATPAYDPTTNAVFVGGADGMLYKLSAASGQILGTYSAGAALNKAVLLVGNSAYVIDANGALHKVDTASLSRQWLYSACTTLCDQDTPPAYSSSRNEIVFATGDLFVHGVDAASGVARWHVKPTPNTAGGSALTPPYTFAGGWPVIAEQHGIVFVRLQLPAGAVENPLVFPSTNTDTRNLLTANPSLQNLFALSLDTGAAAFVPAVGYGTTDQWSSSGTYQTRRLFEMPAVKVWPNGDEVAYIQFRSGQHVLTGIDHSDGDMGEMVLDATTVPGLNPGDLRFLKFSIRQGGPGYPDLIDEEAPISLAGSTLLWAHFASSDSVRITDRSDSLGLTYASPIATANHPSVLRQLGACPDFNPQTHWTSCTTLTLYNEGRNWTGPGFWQYWNTKYPSPNGQIGGEGVVPRYTYVSDNLLFIEGSGGDIMVLHHS